MSNISQYHLKLIADYGPCQVWEIDGEQLRGELDIEFTNFGMYPDFDYIPKNEFLCHHHLDKISFELKKLGYVVSSEL